MTTPSLSQFPAHSASQPDSHDVQLSGAHAHVTPGEIAIGVVIGRASEYFDFFVFGIACSLVFPSEFFPNLPRLDATLWSFVIFSFAFIARPFGTLLSMRLQRRFGRETKLTAALFLLGTCTAGISFLPGFNTLGFSSVVLLSIFRIGQGLALGGSWDGLPSLLAMTAPEGKRGWYAMFGQLGAPIGFVMAASLFAFLYGNLSSEDFLSWGWRYPFFVAFAINVVALFSRLQLVANEEFAGMLKQRELEPSRLRDMPAAQWRNVLIGAFAALASFALFHLITVFPLSWITLFTKQNVTEYLISQIIGAFLAAGAIVISGLVADRVGRRNLLGGMAFAILVFALFSPVMLHGSRLGAHIFIIFGFVLLGLSYSQAAGVVTSNFEPRFRYTGAALTADLSWLIGAAFAPLVALGLASRFGLAYVGLYLLTGAAGTLLALRVNKTLGTKND